MKVESPAKCISIYRDVFPKDHAEHFVKNLEKETTSDWSELHWGSSKIGNGVSSKYRTSLSCSLIPLMRPYPETELSKYFWQNICSPIEKVTEDYRTEYFIPSGMHAAYQLLKYYPESEYHAHVDHAPDNRRVFSMVSCILAPEDGGDLEFPFFDLSIPMETGSVILFPSNFPYLHIAHSVNSGIKYSLVTWYE